MQLPRANVSCNSGARIGLAQDIVSLFHVKFKNPSAPQDGFEHIYLEASDYEKVADQVDAERLPNGTYKLNAIIGRQVSSFISMYTFEQYIGLHTYI